MRFILGQSKPCWEEGEYKDKGVSPDTPSHIIQKHYEFYLANKIKSYRYMILFLLGCPCIYLRYLEANSLHLHSTTRIGVACYRLPKSL